MIRMDPIFYLTILAGLLTVILSGITYYQGKKKEIEAEQISAKLLQRTAEVADLQNRLLAEVDKTREKSDAIIILQNKLNDSGEEILRLSNENSKQVIGEGPPTLAAHVYPDSLIALQIANENRYPIYDISINFPNPDQTIAVRKMVETKSNLSWEDIRNQWIFIPPFNLPGKSTKMFYQFRLPEAPDQIVVFLNIVARHAAFSGRIVIKRNQGSFSISSEVRDMDGNVVTQLNN